MADKIIIDGGKKREKEEKKDTGPVLHKKYDGTETDKAGKGWGAGKAEGAGKTDRAGEAYGAEKAEETGKAGEAGKVEEPIPLDENVWGNDNSILHKLDEKQLADRRLFVRVRYVQKVECNTVYDKNKMEPVLLPKPIVLFISDISMGGIGVISDEELREGEILGIHLVLDNIPYDIKGEVVYCFRNEDKYRAGLKIVQREKRFIKHLKIYVARISLTNAYGRDHDRNAYGHSPVRKK